MTEESSHAITVAEDRNCFMIRLKYRLEPKRLAQLRFDSWRSDIESYPNTKAVVIRINGLCLIRKNRGMIPSPSPISRNCVPIRSPTLRNAERKLLNESKKEHVNRDTHSECPGLFYVLNRR